MAHRALCHTRGHRIASLRIAHPPRFYDRVAYHVVSCRVLRRSRFCVCDVPVSLVRIVIVVSLCAVGLSRVAGVVALSDKPYPAIACSRAVSFHMQAGNCTLREAAIVASVMKKVRVPQVHSASAMLKIANTRYSGASSQVLKVLIDKKYSLPTMVVDGIIEHFCGFATVAPPLPLVWHTCLLSFVQKYKADVSPASRER